MNLDMKNILATAAAAFLLVTSTVVQVFWMKS